MGPSDCQFAMKDGQPIHNEDMSLCVFCQVEIDMFLYAIYIGQKWAAHWCRTSQNNDEGYGSNNQNNK